MYDNTEKYNFSQLPFIPNVLSHLLQDVSSLQYFDTT